MNVVSELVRTCLVEINVSELILTCHIEANVISELVLTCHAKKAHDA